MRFSCLTLLIMASTLGACAHEAENTGVENSSVITLPLQTYAFEAPYTAPEMFGEAKQEYNSPFEHRATLAEGRISRFQRHIITTDAQNNPHAAPVSQYFDDVMDHLELLMADEIKKNNEIALLQEKIPGYEF